MTRRYGKTSRFPHSNGVLVEEASSFVLPTLTRRRDSYRNRKIRRQVSTLLQISRNWEGVSLDNEKSEVSALVEIIQGELRDHERRIVVLEKSDAENKVEMKHLSKALEKIDANTTWTFRTVVGALIAGAIGLLFYFARGG